MTGSCFWTSVELVLSWNLFVWPGTRYNYVEKPRTGSRLALAPNQHWDRVGGKGVMESSFPAPAAACNGHPLSLWWSSYHCYVGTTCEALPLFHWLQSTECFFFLVHLWLDFSFAMWFYSITVFKFLNYSHIYLTLPLPVSSSILLDKEVINVIVFFLIILCLEGIDHASV